MEKEDYKKMKPKKPVLKCIICRKEEPAALFQCQPVCSPCFQKIKAHAFTIEFLALKGIIVDWKHKPETLPWLNRSLIKEDFAYKSYYMQKTKEVSNYKNNGN